MNINLFLCKEGIQSFQDCLKPKTLKRQYDLLTSTSPNGIEYQICLVKGESKEPAWLSFIKDYVDPSDIDDVTNRTCSLVVFFKVNTADGERIFAISNGFGFHILDKDKVEPNFGLITTLNCINPLKIKTVDTRSLGIQTLQKREASNLFTDIGEFGFEFDSELLQTISGACSDPSIGTRIGGIDNLKLSTSSSVPFAEIPQKCKAVYEKFKLDSYKTKFEFIDHIKHEKNSQILDRLDSQLIDAMNQRRTDLKLSVAYPDQIDYEMCEHFHFSGLRKPTGFDLSDTTDVTLEAVYGYLEATPVDLRLLKEKIRIVGTDPATEEARTPREPLYAYMVFETQLDGRRYILSNKKWYYIEEDYLARVENDLQAIAQFSQSPVLKRWPHTKDEGKYNLLYKNEAEYLWLDKQNFVGTGYGRSKIEIADFYHEPTRKLFFVKKLNRSATLSHLFSQATVSANLFKDSTQYVEKFLESLRQRWPTNTAQFGDNYIEDLTFVYTIGTNRPGNLLNLLPVFSKINLFRHLKLMRKLNAKVELAKVEVS